MKILKNSLKMRNPSTAEFEAINGFVGESGVHVGPEMPFGSGVDLWINPTNTDTYTVAEMDDLNKAMSYSTEEQPTGGTWIDGKPIYKRVLVYTINNTSGQITVGTFPEIQTPIQVTGMVEYSNSFRNISHACYESSIWDIGVAIGSARNLFLMLGSSYANYQCTAYIILEYTKTTD